jgi:ATP phosphoribosyltransferase
MPDKDMPEYLANSGDATCIGIIGSDTFDELDVCLQGRLACREVATTGLRLALAARKERAGAVSAKIARGEQLLIATSYRRLIGRCEEAVGARLRVSATLRGSVEAAPELYPDIDGIIDIVDSGETIKQNDLAVVADGLVPVTLAAIWRVSS